MKKLMLAALLIAVATLPALAGDDHAKAEQAYGNKCTADSQSCLNWYAEKFRDRGWAGVSLEGTEKGLRIREVHAGTPADKAGVQVGDYLVAINGVEYKPENQEKMAEFESMMNPGREFTYTIARNGKNKEITFALAQMPMEVVAAQLGAHMLNDHAAVEVAAAD